LDVSHIHLALFLSRATPLRAWDESGIFDREVALYQRLRPHLRSVSIVTSGGPEELDYQNRLGDIRILCNHNRVSANLYSLRAPSIHSKALADTDVLKTNQLDGAWTAVLASKRHHKPVVVRGGYPWARNFEAQTGRHSKAAVLRFLERYALHRAHHVILTTESMKRFYGELYGIGESNITVIPNYIDTAIFRPEHEIAKVSGRVCFVGRLSAVKNLHLLIEAAAGIEGCSLVLIGRGEEESHLKRLATARGVDVEFTGALPHRELSSHINRSDVFVLPSRFEGHPKSLIEAMACGVAVLGTDVDGIRDVIDNERTGLLCPATVDGIAESLRRLLSDAGLRNRLGAAASANAREHYDIDRVVKQELAVYESVSGGL